MHKKTDWGEIIIMSSKNGFHVSGGFAEDKVGFQGSILVKKDQITPQISLIPQQDEHSTKFFIDLILEEFRAYQKLPVGKT